MTRLFGPGGLFELPSHHGVPVRTVDRLPARYVTETVADYWLPGIALCWRVTIRVAPPFIAWPRMVSECVH